MYRLNKKGVRQLSATTNIFFPEKDQKPEREPRGDGKSVCYAHFICGSTCKGDRSKCPHEKEKRKIVKIINLMNY